jgi:hypothetical protein
MLDLWAIQIELSRYPRLIVKLRRRGQSFGNRHVLGHIVESHSYYVSILIAFSMLRHGSFSGRSSSDLYVLPRALSDSVELFICRTILAPCLSQLVSGCIWVLGLFWSYLLMNMDVICSSVRNAYLTTMLVRQRSLTGVLEQKWSRWKLFFVHSVLLLTSYVVLLAIMMLLKWVTRSSRSPVRILAICYEFST